MATLKPRGNLFAVNYSVKGVDGKFKSYYEGYSSEFEATQRKAYIEHLKKNKREDELRQTAIDYESKRAAILSSTNYDKTYEELVERWLPYYSKIKKLSPTTIDSHKRSLRTHILPYFGGRLVSTITSDDMIQFVEHLENTKCFGSKSYNKDTDEVPFLEASSISKIMNTLNASLRSAESWGYTAKRPTALLPPITSNERKSWSSKTIKETLDRIDDPFLHLLVHLTFICSLRAGEAAGIEIDNFDFDEGSLTIQQELIRATDQGLALASEKDIYYRFPKANPNTKSYLVIKRQKTRGSKRKVFLPKALIEEVQARIQFIEKCKDFFGDEYCERNLLFCLEDGSPQEPIRLVKKWTKWQESNGIQNPIDLQGLRKSGQTHKVHITDNNYGLVAKTGGQSTEVLLSNYLAVHEDELENLRDLIENDFYNTSISIDEKKLYVTKFIKSCKRDPELMEILLGSLVFSK